MRLLDNMIMNVQQIKEQVTINFPCANYVIKVIGINSDDFVPKVIRVLQKHIFDLDADNFTLRTSKKGNFVTLQIAINAQSIQQLKDINADLLATKLVQMVL